MHLVLVSLCSHMKYHKLGSLNTETDCLSFGSWKPKMEVVLAGLVPFEGWEGASLPGSRACWQSFAFCLCLHPHTAFSQGAGLCPDFPSHTTRVMLNEGHTLFQYDLLLTSYSCNAQRSPRKGVPFCGEGAGGGGGGGVREHR